jgi:hypothetical protein
VNFFTSTVYSKALAIFLAASLLLLGAVAALTQLIIFRVFNQAEEREMKSMLQRFSVVMDRETRPLAVWVTEWARSDFMHNALLGRDGNDGTGGLAGIAGRLCCPLRPRGRSTEFDLR